MNKLHIGYHKTGTTFLQKLIFPHIPNYKGRIYAPESSRQLCNFHKFRVNKNPLKSCENIINHFKKEDDIFISDEIFSKISHKQLFKLVREWDVLVMSRNLKDLVRSRRLHRAGDFFLQGKIDKGQIDQEVKDFYDPQVIASEIPHLTVLSYERLFAGEKSEIRKLSEYVGMDIENLFIKNINTKINAARGGPRRKHR